MIKSIIYLAVFCCGLAWVIADLVRLKRQNFDNEYKALYIENKILLLVIFFAVAMMHADKIFNLVVGNPQ